MNMLALAPTTLPDTPTLEFLDAAAAAGFPAVSLRLNRSPGLPFHPVVGDPARMREVKTRLQGAGLAVLEVVSFYLRPATLEEGFEPFLPALEFGAELGARYVLTMGDDPEWSRQVESFGRFCDLAARYEMTAAVEYAVSRPIATLQNTLDLIGAARRPNAVVCLDPLNHMRGSGGPELVGAAAPHLFPYAQITDGVVGPGEPDLACAKANGPNVRRWPGEGDVPLTAFLDRLPANVPLSIEGPAPDATHTTRSWAKLAFDKTQVFLRSSGSRTST